MQDNARVSDQTTADALVDPRQLAAPLDESGSTLVLTTNPGIEDVVVEEVRERAGAAGVEIVRAEEKPFGLDGYVLIESAQPFERLEPIALQLRSIHHILHPLYSFALPQEGALETIRCEVAARAVPQMDLARSFRVTSRRNGDHDFSSMDVQRAAGAALVERYACAVDLENYDVEVRVDVFGQTCLVGIQLTQKVLSKRYWRVFQPRAAIKSNVAYAMLRFARLDQGQGALLDPFCGSGTMLIEAAQIYPDLELFGSDMHGATMVGAQINAKALGLGQRIHFQQADARRLRPVYPEAYFNAVVTNPPFGVRMGQQVNFFHLYRLFIEQVWSLLQPGGLLVMLVSKRGVFNKVLEQNKRLYLSQHVRVVETGGVYPAIFVLQRL
jgi:tRNA (guanine6-N2)-methyltransferase